jgi:5-methylcytosine-specific restriction endonuclease McrA
MTDPIYQRTVRKSCIRCGRTFETPAYARKKPSRCPEHRSGWDRKPKERDLAYLDPAYKRNRQIALGREPVCHWRLPGCTMASTQADHVIAVSQGGSNDLSNLVGSCESCNRRRGIQLGNQTRRRKP